MSPSNSPGSRPPRPRVTWQLLLYAASRLTERDRRVIDALAEHQVLTTSQVCDLAFNSERHTTQRMNTLYRLRVVERFRPLVRTGSAPYHWILDEAGAAAVVAADRDVARRDLGWRRDKALSVALNQHLAHTVAVNGFFTALARTARHQPGSELRQWWPQRRCTREYGHLARPDGYGEWIENDTNVRFFLEHDRGTESLDRLAGKLPGYARLARALDPPPPWVLVTVPTTRREAGVRRVLAQAAVQVATAVYPGPDSPANAIWLPLGPKTTRLRLIDLSMPDVPPTDPGVGRW